MPATHRRNRALQAAPEAVAESIHAAANDAAQEEGEAEAPTLASLLAPLRDINENDRKFGARMLLECQDLMEEVEKALGNRKDPEVETLAEQDRCDVRVLCDTSTVGSMHVGWASIAASGGAQLQR